MIENEVIVRLESMVERLNRVLEQNLFDQFTWLPTRRTNKKAGIEKLLKIEPVLHNLSLARTAKECLNPATASVESYLRAATIVYDITSDLSVDDSYRVFCGVTVQPELNTALENAMESSSCQPEAEMLYNLINVQSPNWSWGYIDRSDHVCSRTFELVTSEQKFLDLLQDGYEDITGEAEGCIKIAYKKECVRITLSAEKEAKEKAFIEYVGQNTYERFYTSCVEVLYPTTIYNSTYKIYVPKA